MSDIGCSPSTATGQTETCPSYSGFQGRVAGDQEQFGLGSAGLAAKQLSLEIIKRPVNLLRLISPEYGRGNYFGTGFGNQANDLY